jgi:hypothetical protein
MEVSGWLYALAALLPGMNAGTHGIEGWMGPRAGLDAGKREIGNLKCAVLRFQSSSTQMFVDW